MTLGESSFMQFIGHLIVRSVSILLGLFLGILAATMFLSLGIVRDVVDPSMQYHWGFGADGLLVPLLGLIASPFVAGAVLAPAAIIIAIAELAHWRGMVSNLLLGGIIAVFAGWQQLLLDDQQSISDGLLIVLLGAGFVGGFVYWLISGRNAGNWLENRNTRQVSSD
ncbi:MAG: hypothetical protein ACR2O0_05725 [Rhizobiaceae bacterium]